MKVSSAPKSLFEIQAWVQRALIYQGESPEHINEVLCETDLTPTQHLAIYQRSYYARLLTCMREQFPALCYALGDDLFNDFARLYLIHHPSKTHTLYELGKRFPAYLADTRPDRDHASSEREVWIDFMIELATFEREVFTLFDCEGCESTGYATTDQNDDDLILQPAVYFGEYQFDVISYYQGVRQALSPELPPMQLSRVLVVRKDFLSRSFHLSLGEFCLLGELKKGYPLQQALEIVALNLDIPLSQVLETWLKVGGVRDHWIQAGVFTCE